MSPKTGIPEAHRSRARAIGALVALVLAGLLLLLSAFAVWVDRVALDSEVFSETGTELIEDQTIREAVARAVASELFANVDLEAALEARLSDELDPLAGVSAAALRVLVPELIERGFAEPRLQRLWTASLVRTQEELVAVLKGGGTAVSTEGGVVTLDLREIVLVAIEQIGIGSQLEARLPENAGRLEVLRSDELGAAQDLVDLLEALVWVLPLLAVGAFGAAVWLAPDRRRAVSRIGISVVVVGIVGVVAARATGGYLVDALVAERDARPAANNAWDTLIDPLLVSLRWLVAFGVLFLAAAWLAGPAHRAAGARRVLASHLASRVVPYAVLALFAVAFLATGPVSDAARMLGVVLAVVLGAIWIEVMRARTQHEFGAVTAPSNERDTSATDAGG